MWQEMYGDWVDRAAKHAKMALDAGVQERQVRLAEMTGALFAEAIRGILQGLELSPGQQAAAPELVRTQLLAIDAQLAS
jgi:hypothetical protein